MQGWSVKRNENKVKMQSWVDTTVLIGKKSLSTDARTKGTYSPGSKTNYETDHNIIADTISSLQKAFGSGSICEPWLTSLNLVRNSELLEEPPRSTLTATFHSCEEMSSWHVSARGYLPIIHCPFP
jgi:hypothetical protein